MYLEVSFKGHYDKSYFTYSIALKNVFYGKNMLKNNLNYGRSGVMHWRLRINRIIHRSKSPGSFWKQILRCVFFSSFLNSDKLTWVIENCPFGRYHTKCSEISHKV